MVDNFAVPVCLRVFFMDVDAAPIWLPNESHGSDSQGIAAAWPLTITGSVRQPIRCCASIAGCDCCVGYVGATSVTETAVNNFHAVAGCRPRRPGTSNSYSARSLYGRLRLLRQVCVEKRRMAFLMKQTPDRWAFFRSADRNTTVKTAR